MEVISANIKVSQQKDYCMICRKWVNECVNHKCPIKHRALIDENMAGIVDRLYNLGIVPMMAMFNLDSTGKTFDFNVNIDFNEHLGCEVLGDLPAGWHYCWDEAGIHGLEYTDCRYNLDVDSAEEQINSVIKGFEVYLDSKDAKAIKAMSLLMAY